MKSRSKTGKTIDIVLDEEKFYFPGDPLRGSVIVHPKSPTKTTQIILRFTGQVVLSVKDKETITLFQRTQNIRVSPDDKASVLEAKQHSFPFDLVVPKELPSTMEFAKKAKVRYVLTAIHDRPMVPESFCPRAHYVVPILEYLNIESPQFKIPQEKTTDAVASKRCQLKVSIPRTGFARGDIVTIKTVVTCAAALVVHNGLRVDLVRVADIRSGKHQFLKEDVLKTSEHDLNIIGPYNFSQEVSCQMPIPTSTPPTIGYDGMTLRMYYFIRAKVRLTDIIEKPKTVTTEVPIVIGTWPLADIPIDDDDDDSIMMSVSDMDEANEDAFRMSGDLTAFTLQSNARSSTPHISLTPKDTVDRSDSKSSKRSASSWHSNQSWDSQALSRNTSLTTPDKLSSSSSFARTPSSFPEPSVPPPPPPQPLTNNRNSMYQEQPAPYYQQQQDPRRQSAYYPSASFSPPRSYFPQPVRSQYEDYPAVPPPPYAQHVSNLVPTQVLQPIATPPPVNQPSSRASYQPVIDTYVDSSDDSSDDEGDLLRIVRKKKKAELRMQQQRSMRL
ncbi:hypothetical protein BJV82DRAFT_629924 [Fennellomyces sp. T-0311]|nr:hypothetical protein BJV82DRAFT_629924 [Fennellomyces sp. T-0311]